MSSVSIVKAVADESVVVSHVEVSGVTIVFPVGHTVTNHEALEVGNPTGGVVLLSLVNVSVNSQSKLRHIDAGIGFT